MALRLSALGLGTVTGFVFAWARMTDPDTFHRMLALRSPTIYLLMASAVGTAFVGSRLLRGRPALLTGRPIGWATARPGRGHVVGSAVFGAGWAVSAACPGPTAAQLGSGRVLAAAVAAGVMAGVWLQPRLAAAAGRTRRVPAATPVQAADVL
jgi:uncharacterized membrane protein YedE/YeeE